MFGCNNNIIGYDWFGFSWYIVLKRKFFLLVVDILCGGCSCGNVVFVVRLLVIEFDIKIFEFIFFLILGCFFRVFIRFFVSELIFFFDEICFR